MQSDAIPTAKQANEARAVKNSHIPIAGIQSRKSASSVNRSNSNSSNSGRALKNVHAVMVPAPAPVVVSNNLHGDAYTSSSSDTSNSSAGVADGKPLRVESKLERSNTFCMDASDNPVVLQIME